MFDPTVFDNLKVVIEGAVYDLDLYGEFMVLNRKDIVDLATMKREYTITLKSDVHHINLQGGEIKLSMDLENLSVELLRKSRLTPGCKIQIGFSLFIPEYTESPKSIEAIIESVWGLERSVKQTVSFSYSKDGPKNYKNHVEIDFNRLIGEDNVDGVLEMIQYLCATLTKLDEWLKKE
jgi:hypothetical protein